MHRLTPPPVSRLFTHLVPVACAAVLVAVMGTARVYAASTILIQDTFADGGFTNGVDANDAAWASYGSATRTINSGALRVAAAGSDRGVIAGFSATTLAVGETLSLTFDFRYTVVPAADNSSALRFGLYNTATTAVDYNDDFGFRVNTPYGGTSSPGIIRETGTSGAIGAGSDSTSLTTPGTFSTFSLGTSWNTLTFSFTRTDATTLTFDFKVDNISLMTSAASNNSGSIFTFDEVAFVNRAGAATFELDNINVTLTTVPEPATTAIAIGCIALTGAIGLRRRKAQSAQPARKD